MVKRKTSSSKLKKIILSFVLVMSVAIASSFLVFYRTVFTPNLISENGKAKIIYIHTGSTFTEVMHMLQQNNLLRNSASFQWVAERMGYTKKVKPGRYRVFSGMNNKELVSLLRSGRQEPVKVIFSSLRTIQELCGQVGSQLEADSFSIANLLTNEKFLARHGLNTDNCLTMFIPNTYEFYWNTSASQFFDRMKKEYISFWNTKRTGQAKKIGLSPVQVAILASIVEKETNLNDEKPVIAGVYLNRLKKGWKLEADPTLVFASGNFSIKRVLNEHKEIESPYNTYMHEGLPPGPICLPSVSSIEAVLNPGIHEYMFFCAREDFSGYHSFARDYASHLVNAKRFQRELNRRNIRS